MVHLQITITFVQTHFYVFIQQSSSSHNRRVRWHRKGFGRAVSSHGCKSCYLRKKSGKITSIKKGDINAEVEVVVKTGSISVIVTNKRKPYHYLKDFTDLKLDPLNVDILMVKIGYLVPELYEIRGDWVMALTPGGVDQDLERLNFKRIKRPMFPFDKDMSKPDLSARLIELSNKK